MQWKVYGSGMEVEILHVAGCPNLELARRRVEEAAGRIGVEVAVTPRRVVTEAEAITSRMPGSPTILVAGRDVGERGVASLACRMYPTVDGYEGAPALPVIVAALVAAAKGANGAEHH